MKEPMVAGILIVALLFANSFAASHAPPSATSLPQPAVLDRWQEEHLEQYTKLRPLLFQEYAPPTALCTR